ncbi:hypothetical protein GWK47_051206 [Chionoecetes opilio]|uniref:Uncharacterized protein n=1 Tax=Chionoecetes opilio TaxID=41210 RepID=A0A8J4YA51_CHIOP|nr:hypothetical protein GWK47_051206 [Chionoecetes opilio]
MGTHQQWRKLLGSSPQQAILKFPGEEGKTTEKGEARAKGLYSHVQLASKSPKRVGRGPELSQVKKKQTSPLLLPSCSESGYKSSHHAEDTDVMVRVWACATKIPSPPVPEVRDEDPGQDSWISPH